MGGARPTALLVGRDREVQTLRRLLSDLGRGRRWLTLLAGEAGIGKTRLLDLAVAEARGLGLAVAMSRCDELARLLPFAPMLEALDLPLLPAPPRGEVTGDRRTEIIAEILDGVQMRAVGGGMVLVVDDLHWADDDTLLALRMLSRQLHGLPLGLLLSLRPHPRSSALDAFLTAVEEVAPVRLNLSALDAAAATSVIAEVVGRRPSAALSRLAQRANGNPFLLVELIHSLIEESAIRLTADSAEVAQTAIPRTFAVALTERVGGLGAPAREVVTACAVLGTRFSHAKLATALRRPVADVGRALDVLAGSGFLVDEQDGVRFRHDLVREAIYGHLPEDLRRALHRDIAAALVDGGYDPIEVAPHLIAAFPRGDVEAVRLLTAAADNAATRSPDTAAELILEAIDLLPPDSPQRPTLLASAARYLLWAGRPLDAEVQARAYLALHTGAAAAPVQAALIEALMFQGKAELVVAEASRARADMALPVALRAHLASAEANARLFIGSLGDVEAAVRDAIELGRAAQETGAVCMGLVASSCARRFAGDLDDSLALIDEAVAMADAGDAQVRMRQPRIWKTRSLAALDRLEEAEGLAAAGRAEAERLGLSWSLPQWHATRAMTLFDLGRWDEATAEAETALVTGETTGAAAMAHLAIAVLAEIAVRQGDADGAREWLRRGWTLVSTGARFAEEHLVWPAILVESRCGDRNDATGRLERLCDSGAEALTRAVVQRPETAAGLVGVALQAARRDRAGAIAEAAQQAAARNPDVLSLQAAALHSLGLMTQDAALLLRAVAVWRRTPRPLARALCCTDAADLVRTDAADGVNLLNEAAAVLAGIGAIADYERIEARLREIPRHGAPRRSSNRPVSGWESLTAAERSVAELVAAGLTNSRVGQRLFISPHTVDSHLRHIFTKLEIRSRVELATVVATVATR